MRPSPVGSPADGRGHGHRHPWSLVAFAVLLVGVAASVLGARAWQSYVGTQQTQASTAAVSGVSQALTSALQQDGDFTGTATTLLSTTPGLTNKQLARWFGVLDTSIRYPGVFGLTYIEVVGRGRVGAFASVARGDPPFGLPVSSKFSVSPATASGAYCLTRYGYAELPQHVTASLLVQFARFVSPMFNYCANSIDGLFRLTAETGKPVVESLGSLFASAPAADGLRPPPMLASSGIMAEITPLYAGGLVPASTAHRQQGIRGWVLSLFDASQIVAPVLKSAPHASLTLEYRNPSGVAALVGPDGPAQGGDTTRELVLDGTHWTATLREPATPSGVPPSEQGLAVLAGGLLLSLLLFLLIHVLSRSRTRALDLVDQRTNELEYQALHDALTGLPNRTLIFDRANQMLARAQREHLPVAVLVIDLAGLKFVNDSYGHDAGDQLLRVAARRFEVTTRASDSVGRLGGDEFVVLAEGSSVTAGADLIAERLLAVLNEPFDIGEGHTVVVGARIGIATGLRSSAEQLLRDADVALYEAKSRGQNQFVTFDPDLHATLSGRGEMESELRSAVAHNEFRVLYQPILRLGDSAVVKVEALVRWNHPTRGIISPADFIPVLEESGLITSVGRTVLEESCRQARIWHDLGFPSVGISVNVSARQLESDALVATVEEVLERSTLDPAALTLEITESTIMRDIDATVGRLTRLKALGIKLAVDDFGTGYSSLAYLQRFPVDELKIDRSFISGVGDTLDQGALIRTLVQLGRLLGLETVAEGIESPAQLERLRLAGCDCGQGYLFARPLDAPAIESFLRQHSTAYAHS